MRCGRPPSGPEPPPEPEEPWNDAPTLTFAALFAGSILLGACGDDDSAWRSGDANPVADGARRIEVTGEDFAFDPEQLTAVAGEDLLIALTSVDMLHDFAIDELDVHIGANRDDTVEGALTAAEPGTYTFYCSVPGHRSAGMEGIFTVE